MHASRTLSRTMAGAVLLLLLSSPGCWKVDPDLKVSTNDLNFGTGMENAPVVVTNDSKDKAITSGVTALDYQFTSNRAWATISPPSGHLDGEQSATHTVAVDRSALELGAHVATVTVTSNGGNETITVRVTRTSEACSGAPDAPSGPSPRDDATGVSVATSLEWEEGESQCDELNATYDVYFGTQNPPPFHHNNGTSKSWDPAALAANTLYYWRVVAKDANGSTAGTTWSFRTAGIVACDKGPTNIGSMSPPDGADDVDPDVNLSWGGGESQCPGLTATYDVYFGTNSTPPLHHNNGSSRTWDPGTLEEGETYYWRIVAKDANGSTSSPVRDFRIRDCDDDFTAPCNPSPKDGKDDVNTRSNLSWGCGASLTDEDECEPDVTYVVYLGTSKSLDGDDIVGTTTSRSYNLPDLDGDRTYYWKVIARSGSLSKSSATWEFTTR